MARLTIADLVSQEVELPGEHVYTIKPATRSLIAQGDEIDERLRAVADDDIDGIVAVYGELLDLRLASAVKGQPHASTVIKRLWDGDQITLPQLEQLLQGINASDRPT